MDAAQLQLEYDAVILQLAAWNAALTALAASPKAYSINTGQTTTSVTRNDFDKINSMIRSLRNQADELCLRINGGGSMIGKPLA